jgi:hypothetical protein
MHPFIQDFMVLFEGYQKAYGYYSGELTTEDGGKMVGRRASVTGPVTFELWTKHITGEMGLGIIPINEESKVKFATIDIDEYPLDLPALNASIQKNKLPLVLCRTKSGGAHLYLFLTQFHDAGEIQRKMREMASLLGYGSSEIFPKQTKINADRGDVGNWINVPYFKAAKSNRYALDSAGTPLGPVEFVTYAKSMVVDPIFFVKQKFEEEQHLVGGPPCLNHLISVGFPKGTRNNGLLNLAVYAKKMMPTGWEQYVQEYNHKYLFPPLDPSEVLGVIRSLQKKDFFYMCKQSPIAQYCNMPKCRSCKFGIGTSDMGMPKLGTLTKLRTDPPIWFLEVEGGGRLELDTDDLQNQRKFQAKCMAALNIMPILPKNEIWQEIVSQLLANCNEVEVPVEATPSGMLRLHLEEFCTSRVQAKTPEDMLLGKVWTNNGFHYFRMKDFTEYLERKKFNQVQRNFISLRLRDWGADHRFFNLKGKGTNTTFVKEFTKQEESFEVPAQQTKVPY